MFLGVVPGTTWWEALIINPILIPQLFCYAVTLTLQFLRLRVVNTRDSAGLRVKQET